MRNKVVLIRADANKRIGFGHISRCICIAEKLAEKKYIPVFILKDSGSDVIGLLDQLRFSRCYIGKSDSLKKEAAKIKNIILNKKAATCIFDSYTFNENYFLKLKGSSAPLILIDDRNYLISPEVDIIINGNIFAEDLIYNIKRTTSLYLGADYFIMDASFRPSGLKDILKRQIFAGMCLSSVKFGVLLKLAKFLSSVNFDRVDIILTAFQKKYYKELLKYFSGAKSIKIYFDLDARDFSSVVKKNMFFFTTGGTMMCQSLSSGCITYAYPVNKFQQRNVVSAEEKGLAKRLRLNKKDLGNIKRSIMNFLVSRRKRSEVIKKAAKAVDGKGTKRVVRIILKKINEG